MINLATRGIIGGGDIEVTTRIVHPLKIDLSNKKPKITISPIRKKITLIVKGGGGR